MDVCVFLDRILFICISLINLFFFKSDDVSNIIVNYFDVICDVFFMYISDFYILGNL